MTAVVKSKMTVDQYLEWSEDREGAWELVEGEPVRMESQWVAHTACRRGNVFFWPAGADGLPGSSSGHSYGSIRAGGLERCSAKSDAPGRRGQRGPAVAFPPSVAIIRPKQKVAPLRSVGP